LLVVRHRIAGGCVRRQLSIHKVYWRVLAPIIASKPCLAIFVTIGGTREVSLVRRSLSYQVRQVSHDPRIVVRILFADTVPTGNFNTPCWRTIRKHQISSQTRLASSSHARQTNLVFQHFTATNMRAVFSLALPILGTFAAVNPRAGQAPVELPVIDTATLPGNLFSGSGDKSLQSVTDSRALHARLCEPGYPYLCNGFCCRYNKCCARQCCLPATTFCGADGLCYIRY
jgi:hypothetical protein